MLPLKITNLVKELRDRTESGEISWDFDENDASVSTSIKKSHIDISIVYRFDTTYEVGAFRIYVTDSNQHQTRTFGTNQESADFNLVSALYDSGQASGLTYSF